MKQKLNLIPLLVVCLTLSSCFGIEEKILIHKDGTGTFTYSIDATKMMTEMIDMIEKLDKAFASDSTDTKPNKNDKKEDLRNGTIEKMKEDFIGNKDGRINNVKGISGYSEFIDTTGGKFIMGVRFNFDKVASLNEASKTMLMKKEKEKKSDAIPPATYEFKDGVLTRELNKKAVEGLIGSDKDDKMTKALMKDFKYIIVVESDKDVKTATAPGATIKKTGNKVVIDYQVMDKSKEIIKANMKSEVKIY